METTTLFVCASCGTPVELSAHDAAQMPIWESILRRPVILHCVECASVFRPC